MKLGKHKHYKGNDYDVIAIAKHSDNGEDLVIYKALYSCDEYPKGQILARPKKMFEEKIFVEGKTMPRFEYIG